MKFINTLKDNKKTTAGVITATLVTVGALYAWKNDEKSFKDLFVTPAINFAKSSGAALSKNMTYIFVGLVALVALAAVICAYKKYAGKDQDPAAADAIQDSKAQDSKAPNANLIVESAEKSTELSQGKS